MGQVCNTYPGITVMGVWVAGGVLQQLRCREPRLLLAVLHKSKVDMLC
jgi:hypothetical protein